MSKLNKCDFCSYYCPLDKSCRGNNRECYYAQQAYEKYLYAELEIKNSHTKNVNIKKDVRSSHKC